MSDGWRFERLTDEQKTQLASLLRDFIQMHKGISMNVNAPIQARIISDKRIKEFKAIFESLFVDDGKVVL